ncbi:CAP domain-containing protein [Streptomyces nigrescens]|uniref:CAP domain-containing protein n=1 Tax=Streptomyces nigrescens TaxID=1920 RepID=UPI003965AA8B
MGRHRRLANPTPAAPGPRPVDAPTATGPAAGQAGPVRHRSHRAARPRGAAPVRTGLLGVSAAMAMGAVAVASGLIPGGGQFDGGTGDGPGERVRAGALPETTAPQGGLSASPTDRATLPASRGSARSAVPGSTGPTTPTTSPSPHRPAKSPTRKADSPSGSAAPTGHPSASASTASPHPTVSAAGGTGNESSAEAQVLALVNQERSKAGCSPVTADPELASLAQRFSDDMARRNFFDHTDPDGHTPWDRAEAQGISDLGGENIARGQATAQAVMDTWMHSPGHRANILNCEYKTLGVGAHFGPGGPWWTQDFGF